MESILRFALVLRDYLSPFLSAMLHFRYSDLAGTTGICTIVAGTSFLALISITFGFVNINYRYVSDIQAGLQKEEGDRV